MNQPGAGIMKLAAMPPQRKTAPITHARAARALRPGLRRVRVVAFPGLGPMALVTRSDIVNAESASLVAVT